MYIKRINLPGVLMLGRVDTTQHGFNGRNAHRNKNNHPKTIRKKDTKFSHWKIKNDPSPVFLLLGKGRYGPILVFGAILVPNDRITCRSQNNCLKLPENETQS